MEQKNHQPLVSAKSILASLPTEKYDTLCAESVDQRKIAVNAILSRLDEEKEESQANILQSIPIVMLTEGRFIEAANFITLAIEWRCYFDIRVIIEVMQNLGTSMLNCADEWDVEAEDTFREVLYWFCEYILVLDWYNENPSVYITLGSIYEGEKKVDLAIQAYKEAIILWSTDAYRYLADIYERLWRYSDSAEILKKSYDTTKDDGDLQRCITALSKSGRRKEAHGLYEKLSRKYQRFTDWDMRSILQPFIVLTEEIRNDRDIREFETALTMYFSEGDFVVDTQVRNLAKNASIYISNEIESINKALAPIDRQPKKSWTDEQGQEYIQLIMRRLYLMQVHVIIIQSDKYLDMYLHDMREFVIDGNPTTHTMIRWFFMENFSPYVRASYKYFNTGELGSTEKMSVFESLRIHLVHIAATFSQGTFYDTIRDVIEPMIESCEVAEDEWDEISITAANESLHYTHEVWKTLTTDDFVFEIREDPELIPLRKESKNYEALSESTKNKYINFIESLDLEYGTFFRRSIQQLVRDAYPIPPEAMKWLEEAIIRHDHDHEVAFAEVLHNMEILLNNTDIALLVFIEEILLWKYTLDKWQSFAEWIEKYWFNDLDISDALLLACIFDENWHNEEAVELILLIPWMLEEPQALSILMQYIRYMDNGDDENSELEWEKPMEESNQTKFIKVLDNICSEQYGVPSFFWYFEWFIKEKLKDKNVSNEMLWYILVTSAHMKCITGWKESKIVDEFKLAWEYGINSWYINAGNILQEVRKYDEALECFLLAHNTDQTIETVRHLVTIYIILERYTEVWSILDNAVNEWYDVMWYISAAHFYQWNTTEALRWFVKIIQKAGDVDLTFPPWYDDNLDEAIGTILSDISFWRDGAEIALLGSYIQASYVKSGKSMVPENYLKHAQYIDYFLSAHSLEDAIGMLMGIIPVMTGTLLFPRDTSDTMKAMKYLQFHLINIDRLLHWLYNSIKDDANMKLKYFNLLNEYRITVRSIFQKFPDSQWYRSIWERWINLMPTEHDVRGTIHNMPTTIQ